jgi:hypothetical protein
MTILFDCFIIGCAGVILAAIFSEYRTSRRADIKGPSRFRGVHAGTQRSLAPAARRPVLRMKRAA